MIHELLPSVAVRARVAAASVCALLLAGTAQAQLASPQVVPNIQPSVAMYYGVDAAGFVRTFASSYLPAGVIAADGREVLIADHPNTFAALGTFFGGDGITAFRMPDLTGRSVVGASSALPVGSTFGAETNTLTTDQFPAAIGGAGLMYDNRQPGIALRYLINNSGIIPELDRTPSGPFVGQMALFAGGDIPEGWLEADGRELVIADADSEILFNLIGTTFGGDGVSTFALPDMRNRLATGASAFEPVGLFLGTESTLLTDGNVAGQLVINVQPSATINFSMALTGIFPSSTGVGEVTSFADGGNFFLGEVIASAGLLFDLRGQTLALSQNVPLFLSLGTNFGGDGRLTFGLPDLRERTIIGAGASAVASDRSVYAVGDEVGVATYALALGEVQPPVTPVTPVPEPSSWVLLVAGGGALLMARRRCPR